MNKIKVVHVDDSADQLRVVSLLLKNFEEVLLLKQYNNAKEAADFIISHEVDLAILDIEMPGENGFWLADKIKDTNTLIVFLTSHSDYTLQAFEACAIHYILKPTTKKSLEEIFERFRWKKQHAISNTQNQTSKVNEIIQNYFSPKNYPKRIFIDNVHKTTIVNLKELVYLQSFGSYTIFKTIGGEEYKASKMLKTYEKSLINHPDFLRIQRCYIINKAFAKSIVTDKVSRLVEMQNGALLPVSPNLKDKIYDYLNS